MKLSSMTIYIIGLAFAMIALSFALFMHVLPESQHAQYYKDATDKLNTEASKMKQAEERVRKAKELVLAKATDWRSIAATRTPPDTLAAGGIDLNRNAFQLTVDTKAYRNNIQRAVNAQVRKGGVKVINGPYVQGVDPSAPATSVLASFYNYPALGFPAVIFDLGTVTVQGTYGEIMKNIQAYKSMPHYLAVTDGLRIDGTSPNLTATYNLSIVGLLRSTVINGQAPEGAGGGNGGGGGAGPMGPAGMGMPGAKSGKPGISGAGPGR
jgi:hypothetical protein